MVSPLQTPQASERLEARLAAVGVQHLGVDISGGRATFERLDSRPNILDAVPAHFARTFRGCYLMATGLNDAADGSIPHSAGSYRQRIDAVLRRIGERPVLWPLISTAPGVSGPYANTNAQRFDAELRAATARYPQLRLYDWPTEMDPAWREGDGIHECRRGSRARALMVARAVTVAFPVGEPANSSRVAGSVPHRAPSADNRPDLPVDPGDQGSYWAADSAALVHYTSGFHAN